MAEFWAHTPTNTTPPHLLREHLRTVTDRTLQHVRHYRVPHVQDYARIIGLLHDLGKYKLEFQTLRLNYDPRTGQRTTNPEGKVDHSSLGAFVTRHNYKATDQGFNVMSQVIAAHHAGLHTLSHLEGRIQECSRDREGFTEAFKNAIHELPEINQLPRQVLPAPFKRQLSNEFFTRMLLSALVDADFMDTEAHCSPQKSSLRTHPQASLEVLNARLEEQQQQFQPNSSVNVLRQEMYQKVIAQAKLPTGFFRLSMPTGAGKTRTSLAFALQHALHHDLSRVIYAIPFTSIIDQTAQVFKDLLNQGNEENVLEHHSALDPKNIDALDTRSWIKLTSENWNAPVVVTTTVQLFESLFANRTSQLRKLHNIAGSVLVLDEVQTLPAKLLKPIMDTLSELVSCYQVTVVFCTATQPAFDAASGLNFTELQQARDLLPDAAKYFEALKRVKYHLDTETPKSWEDIAEELKEHPQVLCILNTRPQSRELFDALQDPQAIQLSTWLFPKHRKMLLKRIRRQLQKGLPCRVISTQLIECGVDVDFPVVYRALGPLDALVQAAGRCNREGKMADLGQVVIFRPEVPNYPRDEYFIRVQETEKLLKRSIDLDDPQIFQAYFTQVHRNVEQKKDEHGKTIQDYRQQYDYPAVKQMFRMIDSDMVSVVITRMHARKHTVELKRPQELLKTLEHAEHPGKDLWRELQQYTVSIYVNQVPKLQRHLRQITRTVTNRDGSSKTIEMQLYEWRGIYDFQKGLVAEDDLSLFVN
ncbi:CRISPR-associated helicase Cas3' [Deinococcus cellulosilyticus]|uniref:CRISPR-associated helicase/endonuclease Cas3 n=1 Tax=Deinococcus cellulosilyticus (strain DSM 18568 / NBRC 106333 / KACC 11606 / 5516J-15) TaxID=1223518 RepID=A0A511N0A3_DEIC1|nr:CRISPR-associated helicase Cas3' [Deinococcus cellulosilyticus]GEM46310.1 CRISPR-associated helicase/endonuclease Cas3 [Deinococcus cellulosilyticus NBRC 106333 = KACC 11606]